MVKSRYKIKQQELVDEGDDHEGVIAAVDYKPNADTDFGVKDLVILQIDTDQDGKDGDPIRVPLTLTDNLHPSARLYKVLEALGKEPKQGFDFNTLLGIEVEYGIEHGTGKDGRKWNNIKNRELRLKRNTQQKAADDHSEKRVGQAIESYRQQPQFKSKKNGEAKSQWEGKKKKALSRPEPEKDDGPLYPPEDENEINDEDVPY